VYLGYKLLKYAVFKYKSCKLEELGNKTLQERNSKTYTFKSVANEELILSLDVTGLRDHLLKQSFTSVDLINVFARRCYTIGRSLNLTTEENFE
jgi:hypothetical protein